MIVNMLKDISARISVVEAKVSAVETKVSAGDVMLKDIKNTTQVISEQINVVGTKVSAGGVTSSRDLEGLSAPEVATDISVHACPYLARARTHCYNSFVTKSHAITNIVCIHLTGFARCWFVSQTGSESSRSGACQCRVSREQRCPFKRTGRQNDPNGKHQRRL